MRAAIVAGLMGAALTAAPAIAADVLLMIERPGCVWCAAWHEEVGDAYAKTEEGRRAPLRRVDLTAPWPADLATVARDVVTPTFVLLRDGVEAGRIRGYPGEDFFWGLLGQMLGPPPPS